MSVILSSPLLGLVLCLITHALGRALASRYSHPLANPLVTATVLCILLLKALHIPYEAFSIGATMLSSMIGPATIVLAIGIYQRRALLRKHVIPIFAGCAVGAGVSVASVRLLSRLMGLDVVIASSLLPKSVTNAIAIELSPLVGGIPSVTIFAVLLTGISVVMVGPLLSKWFHLDDSLVIGIALGTSAHLIGTSKAITLGETEGAMAGIAICITGLMTTVILLFL